MKINENNKLPTFIIKKRKNENKFFTKSIKDLEEWYMMGYYLGDGWARWDRNTEFNMVFNNNDVEELVPRFKKICNCSLKAEQKGCKVYNFYSKEWSFIVK